MSRTVAHYLNSDKIKEKDKEAEEKTTMMLLVWVNLWDHELVKYFLST